jgi:hypothetical protein
MVDQLKQYSETYAKFNDFTLVDETSSYYKLEVKKFLETEGFEFSFNREVFNHVRQETVTMNTATFKMRFKTTGYRLEDMKVMNGIDEYFPNVEDLFIACFEVLEY